MSLIIFCKIVIKMVSWRKFLEHFLGQLHSSLQCAASGATGTPRTSSGFPEHCYWLAPCKTLQQESVHFIKCSSCPGSVSSHRDGSEKSTLNACSTDLNKSTRKLSRHLYTWQLGLPTRGRKTVVSLVCGRELGM